MKRMILVAVMGALLVALTAGGAFAVGGLADIDCSGDNTSTCNGTASDDDIEGADDGDDNPDDDITARNGDDDVEANGGDDEVEGNGGADRISGGPGDDLLTGGKGNDCIEDTDGSDPVGWENGGDACGFDFEEKELECCNGDSSPRDTDILRGGENGDTLDARDGDGLDILNGGPGRDECLGDPGDDFISCEVINGEEQP